MMKRRQFVKVASAVSIVTSPMFNAMPSFGRGPMDRSGPSRLRLGLAAYSLRDYFSFMRSNKQKPRTDGNAIDMIGFLDFCVATNVEAAELTSYFFPPDADTAYFRKLKREAFVRGVTISGTAIGNNFTVGRGERLEREIASAIQWIDKAAELGAPHIRVFAGTRSELTKEPGRIDEAIEAVGRCAEHAAKRGIFLGVENHGNLTADQMLEIMSKVDSPWVGMNLDTGNFYSDDPYGDLQKCVGYAVNVQVKLMMGNEKQEHYPADFDRIVSILREGGYQGFVVLEYENESPYEDIPVAIEQLRSVITKA